jgi:hypothetical protein
MSVIKPKPSTPSLFIRQSHHSANRSPLPEMIAKPSGPPTSIAQQKPTEHSQSEIICSFSLPIGLSRLKTRALPYA